MPDDLAFSPGLCQAMLPLLAELEVAPEDLLARAARLLVAVQRQNEVHNLTRIISADDFLVKHFYDSLLLLADLPELRTHEGPLLDLGCGGGFPSLPLALALPRLQITPMDSEGRKVECVAAMAQELGLANIHPLHARGRETAAHPEHQGRYAFVTARAVAEAHLLIKEARRLLRPDGVMALYKTPEAVKLELPLAQREADKFGLTLTQGPERELPGGLGRRCQLLLHKC